MLDIVSLIQELSIVVAEPLHANSARRAGLLSILSCQAYSSATLPYPPLYTHVSSGLSFPVAIYNDVAFI